jgi:TRIAD3 protein (E3 ubiquitin-protein ligase RNF216)
VRHIKAVLRAHKTLYKAFGVLEEQVRNYGRITKTYSKIGNARNKRGIELQLIEQGSQLPKELHAAKKKVEKEAGKPLSPMTVADAFATLGQINHFQHRCSVV